MLWHYGNADPEFGALQAKKLQDELTDVLYASSAPNTTVEGMLIGNGVKKNGARLCGVGRKSGHG